YLVGFGFSAFTPVQPVSQSSALGVGNSFDGPDRGRWGNHLFTVGGGLALAAVLVPFVRDLLRMRFRRIGAIVILSFKEAIRRRVLLVFGVLLLLFLFPPKWWGPTVKRRDERRTNIHRID